MEPDHSTISPSTKELLHGSISEKKRLNQWLATGICGNDITSSCLYVAAIAAVYAGVLAPLVLLMVGVVLYLYKKIYTEVVEALPLNGVLTTVCSTVLQNSRPRWPHA